jgi:hypothetical protein
MRLTGLTCVRLPRLTRLALPWFALPRMRLARRRGLLSSLCQRGSGLGRGLRAGDLSGGYFGRIRNQPGA